MTRSILFLSDFGLQDEFVGVCHAVMAELAPDVRVIDVTHGIPAGDIRRGALGLAAAAPHAPADAVFLAVVDPGVGTERRAVAVTCGEAILVGPDNGLLSLAWEALGGAGRTREITSPDIIREPMSATFHGRDVFAPAAALLAAGLPLDELGPEVEPASLVRVDLPAPAIEEGGLRAEVIGVDRFGNLQLGARPEHLEAAGLSAHAELEVEVGGRRSRCRRVRTFGDLAPEELGLLEDSAGWLAVVRGGGSASDGLAVGAGGGLLLSLPGWDSAS